MEKHGLYNSETKVLKEHKIKSAIRSSVSELIKREKMNSSTVWSASIHYNTDNIHVHIAMVEKEPSREKIKVYNEEKGEWEEQFKARRKKGSLERMKSVVASKILDRSEKYNEIDGYIRGAVRFKKENNIQLSSDERTKKLFMKAISLLPYDMKQ